MPSRQKPNAGTDTKRPENRPSSWLSQLEMDVGVGASVGIPLLANTSASIAAQTYGKNSETGRRDRGVIATVMPSFSTGGYGKFDAVYTRDKGMKYSMGGGVNAFGLWAGPGGRNWGNIFSAGAGLPQVGGFGCGYGKLDGKTYGAVMGCIYWPPLSPMSGRIEICIRHPALAKVAQMGATLLRKPAESRVVVATTNAIFRVGKKLRDVISALGSKLANADATPTIELDLPTRSPALIPAPVRPTSR